MKLPINRPNKIMISLIKKIFKGKITLHSACAKGDIETVKQCLASGSNVNEINNDDYGCREAPLHTAACENQKECAVLLILKGADINIQDNKGKTPLDWAEEEKNSEISELLRKHGAKSLKEIDPDLFESNIKEEKARYDVILTTRGGNKMALITAVGEINQN
ncbi:MAG: ankyrin repeat domain-containing protein [Verrucomicrobiota bacterium]|nr:ankyrin repeat domain-containing protein [Verrucomicrobiota bacterium]